MSADVSERVARPIARDLRKEALGDRSLHLLFVAEARETEETNRRHLASQATVGPGVER